MIQKSENAVVLCADAKYFPFAYVVCMQLAKHADGNYDIHLLTEDCSHLARVSSDVPFFIQTPNVMATLPTDPDLWRSVSVPPFGCVRLLTPEILKDYRRILYLDSDVRIVESVAPIFGLDMKGRTIAATGYEITNAIPSKLIETQSKLQSIGLDPKDPFLNSGVILIDAEKWRADRMTTEALKCIAHYGSKLHEIDQDCLNIIFRNAWLPLSPRWNFGGGFPEQIENIVKPVIVHNFRKPWNFKEASQRETALFRKMLAETPFAGHLPKFPAYRQLKRYIELEIKRALVRATPFLASSAQRLAASNSRREALEFVEFLLEKLRLKWFADVNQNISSIDSTRLLAIVHDRRRTLVEGHRATTPSREG